MKFLIDESRIVGLVEDKLTSEVAVKLGLAIGTYYGKKSVIATARDFRSDSHMIKRAISSGLMATGIEILDLHAAPTSALQFIVRKFGCDGGISFTGAHYLDGEISVRLLDSTGNELEKSELEKIAGYAERSDFSRVKTKFEIGGIEGIENSMQVYKNALMSFVDRVLISKSGFKAVLDLSLGPISVSVPTLFTDLNIDLTTMNAHRTSAINKVGALFPDPDSILTIEKAVRAVEANLGIIIDVEATKTLFISDQGNIIQPEDAAAFLIHHTLKTRSGTVILSELFTKRYDKAFLDIEGTKIRRVPDSPGNIGRTMENERAVIGATDNGKVYNPLWGAESDGTLTSLTMLLILARSKSSLSKLMDNFIEVNSDNESIFREKQIVELKNISQLNFFRKLRQEKSYKVRDSLIGIKIPFEEGVVHFYLGKEKNEVNILGETSDENKLNLLMTKCLDLVKIATN
jgi:phosphomannomutase